MAANVLSFDGLSPFKVTRQVVGGAALEEMVLDQRPAVFTVAGHAVEPAAAECPGAADVVEHSPEIAAVDLVARVQSVEKLEAEEGSGLKSARVVVGAGRGAGGPDGFGDLVELTDLLGASLGVSRVVTAAGWRPHHEQVGQTGTRISPDLYIPCGISGAIQHWAGCSSAKTILAINTDAEAPMVTRATYAVIGDLHEVVPRSSRRSSAARADPPASLPCLIYGCAREGARMVHGVRRALTAVMTTAVLVAGAACSAGDPAAGPEDDDPTAPGASSSTAEPAAEVDHAVAPPGPRGPGVVAPADILVISGATIPEETVAAATAAKGVTSVTPIALSESVIENKAIRLAAVDPATYRTFVPVLYADHQETWDRLAGGELALKARLKGKVPLDDKDYLQLGAAEDAPAVHVGAYTQQQPLIDAVVNETWIDTIGMTPGNALLIRTGSTPPAKVVGKLEKVFGDTASVTAVDKATRIGLEPGSDQIAVVTGSVADAVGVYRYTVLGGGRIAPEPAWEASHISTETVPILGTITCNTLLFPQLKGALNEIIDRGLADKIHPDEYAGCYYPRFIAGSSTLSNHAFGLALDLNVPGNGRGTVGEMDRGVVDSFKNWGFAWGGDWNYTDPMHFEMAELVSPGGVSARTN